LAVAWNLYHKLKDAGITPDINVFEANSRFGGNADTKKFNFGKGPGSEDKDLIRWADMGVNDFNIPAYKNIVEVMKQIGYTKENGNFRALEDSTTYYDTKGNAFTANRCPTASPTHGGARRCLLILRPPLRISWTKRARISPTSNITTTRLSSISTR